LNNVQIETYRFATWFAAMRLANAITIAASSTRPIDY
jgi:hypothetical protein